MSSWDTQEILTQIAIQWLSDQTLQKIFPWPFFSLFFQTRPKGGASHFSLVKLPTQNYALYSILVASPIKQKFFVLFTKKRLINLFGAHCLKNAEKVSFYYISSEASLGYL